MLDCLIVGGGPAGLSAAIYLARFHLRVLVVDDGHSRAKWIPVARNHPGFPEGIGGARLLERMGEQARRYDAEVVGGRISRLDAHPGGGFAADWGTGPVRARRVLLATGVTNRRPTMDRGLHDAALARGLIRYCPICDGYEMTDRRVGVIGTGEHGLGEAAFLRGFTVDVTLIAPAGPHALEEAEAARARALGIALVDGPAGALGIDGDRVVVPLPGGRLLFDGVYPALGSDVHSHLAMGLGAATTEGGCILVDDHQRTSLPGLYAAGDVVIGLDQISHAMGEGGVAATTVRNDMDRERPLVRGGLGLEGSRPLEQGDRAGGVAAGIVRPAAPAGA